MLGTLAQTTGGIVGADLDLGFGDQRVVTAASVAIRPGEVTALIGANGSGKSTLLRALARLHAPMAGEVRLDDDTPASLLSPRAFARRVTLLSQTRPTPPGVTVRDVVTYGRHPHRGIRSGDPEGPAAVQWAMKVSGVAAMAERGVDELSGGERQRVWLATCLAQRTSTLLLDEPTTYLDLRYQVEVLDLIRELADDHGVAVGVVLHDLQQAAGIADRVVLLAHAHVLASGCPREVMTSEHLSAAFDIPVHVDVDPRTGALRPAPVGRYAPRRCQPA